MACTCHEEDRHIKVMEKQDFDNVEHVLLCIYIFTIGSSQDGMGFRSIRSMSANCSQECESRHEVIVYLRSQESIEITETPETASLT